MSKGNNVKYCPTCHTPTKHSASMSGECLICGYSQDNIEETEQDEDYDIAFVDDDFKERNAKTRQEW